MLNTLYKLIFTIILFYHSHSYVIAQNGIISSYYEKGKLRYEISYANDVLEGTSYWYYPNGNLKEEKTFSGGVLDGWIKFYYESGLLKEEIHVIDGLKDGVHKLYYENGGLKEVRSYEKGILVSKSDVVYDPNFRAPVEQFKKGFRQKSEKDKAEELLCNVQICPEPLGGKEEIYRNLEYPEHAILFGLEGIVTLVATIGKQGDVIETIIVKGLGLGCSEAAEKAVKETKFIPGQNNGSVVESQVTLKIEFKLDKIPAQISNKFLDNKENYIVKADSIEQRNDTTVEDESRNSKEVKNCGIDKCAEPIGGLLAIAKRINIPPVAKRLRIQGEVIVQISVDEYGFVRKTKIIKSIGYGCDEAVEEALYSTKFIPGKLNGEEIYSDVSLNIPIIQDITLE